MKKTDLESLECEYENLFSQKINTLLEYRNITIKTLAQHIGKAANTVSNWKYKRSYPTAPDLMNIALTCEMDILYFYNKEMNPEEADLTLKINPKENQGFRSVTMDNTLSAIHNELIDKVMKLSETDADKILKVIELMDLELIGGKSK